LVAWYGFLASVYLLPAFRFGGVGNTMWGMDKLALGIIIGTITLYAAEKWSKKLLKRNGGKSYFPFQKAVVPFGMLSIVTAILAIIIYI
jgi:hypothetical protein